MHMRSLNEFSVGTLPEEGDKKLLIKKWKLEESGKKLRVLKDLGQS